MSFRQHVGLFGCLALTAAGFAAQPRVSGAAESAAMAPPAGPQTQWHSPAPQSAARRTLFVSDLAGDDAWDGLCPTHDGALCGPKRTLRAAIEAAIDGDEVLIADGVYVGADNKDLDFAGRQITLRSAGDDPAACIIDCEGAGRGFSFRTAETAAATVQGLTIRNGNTDAGGGLHCDSNSNPTFINCVFTGNAAEYGGAIAGWDSSPTFINCKLFANASRNRGGAIYFSGAGPTLTDCAITGNSSRTHGGGVFCEACSPGLTRCTIEANAAQQRGGGFYCSDSTPSLTNCTLVRNTAALDGGGAYCNWSDALLVGCRVSANAAAGLGGGVSCYQSHPTLVNCTITGNAAGAGGALSCSNSSPTLANCILWADTPQELHISSGSPTVTWCDVQGGWPGAGNIDADPGFAFADDPHLLPGSPCIDAGTAAPPAALPSADLEALPRILDGDGDAEAMPDMGAHELQPAAATIALSPTALQVYAIPGGSASQTVSIRNSSFGTLNWGLQWDADWLAADPVTGQSNGEIDLVNLTIGSPDLSYGRFETTLWVGDPQACNSPRAISIVLQVEPLHVPADYPTIQAALDAAFDGLEIVVADGVYTGPGNVNLDFNGKAVTLRSESGNPILCVINCGDSGRGFWFHSGETAGTVVNGFTIVNGFTPYYDGEASGAGILCTNGSSPTISNCAIEHCLADCELVRSPEGYVLIADGGGGMACFDQSHPRLLNCGIRNCTARDGHGGGLLCAGGSSPTLVDCTILECDALGGGGILCDGGSSSALIDCSIQQCLASHGGGGVLCDHSSRPTLTGCTISACRALNSYGDRRAGAGGIGSLNDSHPILTGCLLNQNRGDDAGGVACCLAAATLLNCTLLGNEGSFAGAVYCDHASPILRKCILAENRGAYATAVMCDWFSNPEITACRITAGVAVSGSDLPPPRAILCRGAAAPVLASCLIDDAAGVWAHSFAYPLLRNCTSTGPITSSYNSNTLLQNSVAWPADLWAYTLADNPGRFEVSYSDVQGGEAAVQLDPGATLLWGDGNTDADPAFVSPAGPDGDPQTWQDNDFHLGAGSPCIEAGDPAFTPAPGETDIDGQYRLGPGSAGARRVDQGADEFDSVFFGDLNCDGAINVFDIDPFVLALTTPGGYAAQYPDCDRTLADLNGDGAVNAFDIDPFVLCLTGGPHDCGGN